MPFPQTIEELKASGYIFDGHSPCKGCGATIEWWLTPNDKSMPMDVAADGKVTPHWSTCPAAKDFRK